VSRAGGQACAAGSRLVDRVLDQRRPVHGPRATLILIRFKAPEHILTTRWPWFRDPSWNGRTPPRRAVRSGRRTRC